MISILFAAVVANAIAVPSPGTALPTGTTEDNPIIIRVDAAGPTTGTPVFVRVVFGAGRTATIAVQPQQPQQDIDRGLRFRPYDAAADMARRYWIGSGELSGGGG